MSFRDDIRAPVVEMPRLWSGIVASSPATFDDLLSVAIPDMNPDLILSGVRWSSPTLPEEGDDCIILFDNHRAPWVVTTWPRQTPPLSGGWESLPGTLTFSSQDGTTPVFIASSSVDLTGVLPLGARIKLTQGATVKYFIVVSVGATSVTLYGGTNYTLTSTAITEVYFSHAKAPFGFPLSDPRIWTVESKVTTLTNVGSPVAGTNYNIGPNIMIPVGAWEIEYRFGARCDPTGIGGSGGYYQCFFGLETANNVLTTPGDLTTGHFVVVPAGSQGLGHEFPHFKRYPWIASTKTQLYLNTQVQANGCSIGIIYMRGDYYTSYIRARCAYL